MAIANNCVHPFQGSQFQRSPLRITASHYNTRLGILTLYAAEKRACRAVRLLGDTAGVHDHHVGRRLVSGCQAALAQFRIDGFSIGAARPASEVLNVVSCCHPVSLSTAEAVFRESVPFQSALSAFESCLSVDLRHCGEQISGPCVRQFWFCNTGSCYPGVFHA